MPNVLDAVVWGPGFDADGPEQLTISRQSDRMAVLWRERLPEQTRPEPTPSSRVIGRLWAVT